MRRSIVLLAAVLMCCVAPLAAQTIDPGTGTALTNQKTCYPAWSPDGQLIACSSGIDGIRTVSAKGGVLTVIIDKTTLRYNNKTITLPMSGRLSFTPDGQEIIYTTYIIDESRGTRVEILDAGYTIRDEIPVLMAVNINSKATRVIREEAGYGCYSKSGRYLAYTNYDHRAVTDPAKAAHHHTIALYDSLTKEIRYPTEKLGSYSRYISFSPDETRIAAAVTDTTGMASGTQPVTSIFIVPVDGGTPIDISWRDNPLSLDSFSIPEWSPDGRWILYTAMSDTQRMIFAYNTVSGKTTSVFPSTPVWNTGATWSPDGKKFCCMLENTVTGEGGLYSFDFVEADLGVSPRLQEVPQYIPSEYGTRLVNVDMSTISNDDTRYYNAMQAAAKRQTIPFWSPDGSSVFWGRVSGTEDNGIWKVSAAGGVPVQVKSFFQAYPYKEYLLTAEQPLLQGFASGGKEIVYGTTIIDESRGTVVTTGTSGYSISNAINVLKTLDLTTCETRIVMDKASYGCCSPSGRFFAYLMTEGTVSKVVVADMKTGDSRTVYEDSGKPVAFDPAETCLYFLGSGGCMRVSLDGGAAVKIISTLTSSASLSSDGRFILFPGTQNGVTGLFVYDTTTKLITNILVEKLGYKIGGGSFSPDGKKICYLLNNYTGSSWNRIYVKDFNTDELGIPTAVAGAAPQAFALTGNHPNPFNPSTTIGFSIDRPGAVHLAVYSLSGQKVRELVSGAVMRPGAHSVVWDGRDASGKAVSSGVYITRLVHDGRAVSRKMMLMK